MPGKYIGYRLKIHLVAKRVYLCFHVSPLLARNFSYAILFSSRYAQVVIRAAYDYYKIKPLFCIERRNKFDPVYKFFAVS